MRYPTTTTTTTTVVIMMTKEEISYDGSLLPRIMLLVIGKRNLLKIIDDHVDDYVPPTRPSKREPSILA